MPDTFTLSRAEVLNLWKYFKEIEMLTNELELTEVLNDFHKGRILNDLNGCNQAISELLPDPDDED